MTYRFSHCTPHVREYSFTAFTGADLLGDGDHRLGVGDTFTTPVAGTAHFTVKDDDQGLSGDARRNERGDDRRHQTAEIEIADGVAEAQKIYAESVLIVRDEYGRQYKLVEIARKGDAATDADDFYTYVGDAPKPGAHLTVVAEYNVTSDWIRYEDLNGGLDWRADADGEICIEAEDLQLHNYKVEDARGVSGGELIRLKGHEGEACLIFGANDGIYDIAIDYVDENDGQGAIDVVLNGVVIETIELDRDTDGNGAYHVRTSRFVLEGIMLNTGDEIILQGQRDGYEFARIDKLTFTIAEDPNNLPDAIDDAISATNDAAVTGSLIANNLIQSGLDGIRLVDALPCGEVAIAADGTFAFDRADVFEITAGTTIIATDTTGTAGTLINNGDGTFTYDPNGAFDGVGAAGATDTCTYTIADPQGATDTATVSVFVEGDESPIPPASFAPVSIFITQTLDFSFGADLFADDDAGGVLSYFATLADGSALPGWLTFDPETRTFFGTPDATDVDAILVRITATEPGGQTSFVDFPLTVFDGTRIFGTDQDDSLPGSVDGDLIEGFAGNDTLDGDIGIDVLIGAEGEDLLRGGVGRDVLDGGEDDDHLLGQDDDDELILQGAVRNTRSVLTATLGANDGNTNRVALLFQSGNAPEQIVLDISDFKTGLGGDVLDISSLLNALDGYDGASNPFPTFLQLVQDGDDTLLVFDRDAADADGNGTDMAPQAFIRFHDTLATAFTPENVGPGFNPQGGATPGDLIIGDATDELLAGGLIEGFGDNDLLTGDIGIDVLLGGSGNDRLLGGVGRDVLDGGDTDDRLFGQGVDVHIDFLPIMYIVGELRRHTLRILGRRPPVNDATLIHTKCRPAVRLSYDISRIEEILRTFGSLERAARSAVYEIYRQSLESIYIFPREHFYKSIAQHGDFKVKFTITSNLFYATRIEYNPDGDSTDIFDGVTIEIVKDGGLTVVPSSPYNHISCFLVSCNDSEGRTLVKSFADQIILKCAVNDRSYAENTNDLGDLISVYSPILEWVGCEGIIINLSDWRQVRCQREKYYNSDVVSSENEDNLLGHIGFQVGEIMGALLVEFVRNMRDAEMNWAINHYEMTLAAMPSDRQASVKRIEDYMIHKNWAELIKPTQLEVGPSNIPALQAIAFAEPRECGFGLTLESALRISLMMSLAETENATNFVTNHGDRILDAVEYGVRDFGRKYVMFDVNDTIGTPSDTASYVPTIGGDDTFFGGVDDYVLTIGGDDTFFGGAGYYFLTIGGDDTLLSGVDDYVLTIGGEDTLLGGASDCIPGRFSLVKTCESSIPPIDQLRSREWSALSERSGVYRKKLFPQQDCILCKEYVDDSLYPTYISSRSNSLWQDSEAPQQTLH